MQREVSVLVAVPDATLRRRAAAALGGKRYAVSEVTTGKTLVKCLREKKPAVLLVAEPKPSELRQVRSTSPGTAVITFWKKVQPRASAAALSLADDFVVQPFDAAELQVRVDRIVQRKLSSDGAVAPPEHGTKAPEPGRADVLLGELHAPDTGRLDAKRIAEYLEVPLAQLSGAIGKGYKAVFKSPSSAALQALLTPVHSLLLALRRVYGSRKDSLVWLNSPHPELGGRRPIELVLGGRAEVVTDLVEGSLMGVPT